MCGGGGQQGYPDDFFLYKFELYLSMIPGMVCVCGGGGGGNRIP